MSAILLALSLLTALCMAVRADETNTEQALSDYMAEKRIKWDPVEESTIFVLGDVGSGKTSLTLLLTGAELEAKVICLRTFNITDEHNKIGVTSTEKPTNILPDLMFDAVNSDNEYAFYDCPGFGFSTPTANFATKYTVFDQLTRSKSLKFIFTVIFNCDIVNLLKYIADLFVNLGKYGGAISLIVTKVPHHLTDAEVIDSIVERLNEFKISQKNDLDQNQTKQIQFVDFLLEQNDDKYTRIGIFRMPNEAGRLSKEWINSQREPILHIVHHNLKYVRNDADDFNSNFLPPEPYFYYISQRILNDIDSDFESIKALVKRFMLQEEERHSHNLDKLLESAAQIYAILMRFNALKLKEFQQQFIAIIDDLFINISGNVLRRAKIEFLQHIDFLHILSKQYHTEMEFNVSTKMSNDVDILKAYSKNSLDWYSFLRNLHEKLSTYDYQQKKDIGVGYAPNIVIGVGESGEQVASNLNIKAIFDQLDTKMYVQVQHLLVNTIKLKLLHAVWRQSTQNASYDCLSDRTHLLVKGYNVLLSHAIQDDCFKDAKHIQIFALNKVFIDADVTKFIANKTLDMAIISPTWEIIDIGNRANRILNFEGMIGESMTRAESSTNYPDRAFGREILKFPERGQDGKNGHPGESGGQFLAIGRSIMGQSQINLFMKGGRGGMGQDGGYGLDGKESDSEDIPITKDYKKLIAAGYKYKKIAGVGRTDQVVTDKYIFIGGLADRATDGGHGGCGGTGGQPGRVHMIGFQDSSKFVVHNAAGEMGMNGEGGSGGREVANKQCVLITEEYQKNSIFSIFSYKTAMMVDGSTQPPGENGISGINCSNGTSKQFDAYNPAEAFINYTYHAREHLANETQVSDLLGFLNHLNDDADLKALYDAPNVLITEFQSIEHHYFKLRNEISFIPFYESLCNRIVIYHKSFINNRSVDEVKAINYLYTAVKSRLFAQTQAVHIGVVNVLKFLQIVRRKMETLKKKRRRDHIRKYRDEFKNELDKKITAAKSMIEHVVLPSIQRTIEEIDGQIKYLLKDLVDTENLAEMEKEKAEKNQDTMQMKLVFYAMLGPLKLAQTALTLLGPTGMLGGAVIDAGVIAAENLIDKALPLEKITIPKSLLIKKEVDRISNETKHHFEQLNAQLSILLEVLKPVFVRFKNELQPLKIDMNQLNATIQEVIKTNPTLSVDLIKQVDNARDELMNGVVFAMKFLQDQHSTEAAVLNTIKALMRMKSFLAFGQTGLKIFEQISSDTGKLNEANSIVAEIDHELQMIRKHKLNIYYVMVPQLQLMAQSSNFLADNIDGKSHTSLVIERWSIQNSMKSVRNQFNQMSKSFLVNDDNIMNCIDKISTSITTVIDVYDHIDSYNEKAQLAELISGIAESAQDDFKDGFSDQHLKDAVEKVEMAIDGNLALEQYEIAMTALKQHKFPYAKNYSRWLEWHPNSSPTDIEVMDQKVNELEIELELEQITFSQFNDNGKYFMHSESFYKWDYGRYTDDITNLLKGNAILLNADINNSDLNWSAVKFKEIWIRILLKSRSKQKHFDNVLRKFHLNMVMVGNDYYRCANRIYYFTLEKLVPFKFIMENDRPKNPDIIHNNYGMLRSSEPFLSPYTTWKFFLEPIDRVKTSFAQLEPFVNQVSEMLLEGIGQYMDEQFLRQYCNEDLDRYYRLDSISMIA